MPKKTPSIESSRSKTILITIYLCFVFILMRLFYWQIIKGQELRDKATSQLYHLEKIIPQQGHLLASDSFPLSLDYTYYTLSFYKPNFKTELSSVLNEIEKIKPDFATENAKILEMYNNPAQKWVEFITQFSREDIQTLSSIPGLDFTLKQGRFYPENNLAKNIIINLERYYQRKISGRIGFLRSIVDGIGGNLLTRKNWQKNEIDGENIELSLNRKVQLLAQSIIKKSIDTYNADSASVIIISPQTGEILAMATSEASPSALITKIPSISDLFEPGSIFKPLTMASALDSGSINSNYICEKCNQPRIIGKYTINNWNEEFHPDSTLKDIIKNSDNIGMSYIIERMGQKTFLDYFHRLKLDQKTGVELSGESISPLKNYWSEIDLATASFGQGFAVNQLQMLQAFNTLANNGLLVNLHLTKQRKSEINRVFSSEIVININEILKYAVENSPVAKLKSPDLEVCAKSGTAQVAVGGEYTDSNVVGSYIGFSPCENPKYSMIVTINNPKTSQWGSSTAAPIWFEIAQNLEFLL